ncbi:MAG TPA: hypothetical protein VGN42_21495 [Pirellulales bacterium]|nr:hypothetical protein [Pirellulales bacterium]
MASLNRTHRAWRVASATLVPLVLLAAMIAGALSAAAAPRRSTVKKSTAAPSAAAPSTAAKQKKARPKKLGMFDPADDTVNLFDAMKAGQIEVKLIPKDSTQGRVFIQNKTKKPLNVKLPEAFAATPVLAQMGMGGMNMGGGGGGGQGMGGGMGGMGGGGGGGFFNVPMGGGMGMMGGGGGMGMGGGMGGGIMGGGGGFFNVPAEKEGNFKVPCMCLEHGKPEPRAAMTYKISPIEKLSKKPGVEALCRMLGYGKINQRAAQVAAWHLNNGMSWEKLRAKRIEHADGSSEPYFTEEELQAGMALANQAVSESYDRPQEEPKPSPGETVQAAEASRSNASRANASRSNASRTNVQ